MTEAQLISLIGVLWVLLSAVLGWIGMRIFGKLDKVADKQDAFGLQIAGMQAVLMKQITDGDNVLHHRVTELDRRVVRVETRCNIEHGEVKA